MRVEKTVCNSPCRLGRLEDCLALFCLLGLLDLLVFPGGTWRLCRLSPVLLPVLLSITRPAWADWLAWGCGWVARRGTATLCLLPSPSVLVLVRITRELEPAVGCQLSNIII